MHTLFGDKHVAVQPAFSAERSISIDSSSNLTKVTGTTSDHSLYLWLKACLHAKKLELNIYYGIVTYFFTHKPYYKTASL